MLRLPGDTPPSRRIKRLRVVAALFVRLFQTMDGHRRIRCEGLPADVRTVGVALSETFNMVELYLESSEFPEVQEWEPVPDLFLSFTEYWGDAMPPDEPGS